MFKSLLFLVPFICLVSAKDVEFKDCGGGSVKNVTITPCEEEPCVVETGRPITIRAKVKANMNADKLFFFLGGVPPPPLPFTIPDLNTDGCEGKGLKCPIKAGKMLTFRFKLEVPLKTVNDIIYFVMRTSSTGDHKTLFCFGAPITV